MPLTDDTATTTRQRSDAAKAVTATRERRARDPRQTGAGMNRTVNDADSVYAMATGDDR